MPEGLIDIMLAEDSAITERVLMRLVEWGGGRFSSFRGARLSSRCEGWASAVGGVPFWQPDSWPKPGVEVWLAVAWWADWDSFLGGAWMESFSPPGVT